MLLSYFTPSDNVLWGTRHYEPEGSGFKSLQARHIKIMSKRYSGKSFKDSSIMKKPKLTLKEKRNFKREKKKKK